MSLTKSKESIDEAISLLRQMESQIEIYKYMIARLTAKHGCEIVNFEMDLSDNLGYRFTKGESGKTVIRKDIDGNYNFKERINKLINQ